MLCRGNGSWREGNITCRIIISVVFADDVNLDSLSDCLNLDDGEFCNNVRYNRTYCIL